MCSFNGCNHSRNRDLSIGHAIEFVVIPRWDLAIFSVRVRVILVQVFMYRPWRIVTSSALYRFTVVVCTQKAPLRKWNLVICLLRFWSQCHVRNIVNIILVITASLVWWGASFLIMNRFKAGFCAIRRKLFFNGVRGIVIVFLSRVMRPADRVVELVVDFFVLWRGL